jgi:lysophospholipase L1-like esterase
MLKHLRSRTSTTISLIIVFLFSMTGTVFGKASTPPFSPPYDYVSLGDSLAAGQTPYSNPDSYGYTDILADKLASAGVLGLYGDYGVSTYKTSDVLYQIANDSTVQYSLNGAEIITLDVGANDILPLLPWIAGLGSMDIPTRIVTYPGSMPPVQLSLLLNSGSGDEYIKNAVLSYEVGAVNTKIGLIIQSINAMPGTNPKIYVMGYYNALPDLPQFLPLLDTLNGAINLAATQNGATYVATKASMDKHLLKYLPGDIHPTVQGYRAIAQDFWAFIQPDFLRGLN